MGLWSSHLSLFVKASLFLKVALCESPNANLSMNFDLGLGIFRNTGVLNWTLLSGSTGSPYTGPSSDHTTGSGSYVYCETSYPNIPHKGPFVLEALVSGAGSVSFYYSMNGLSIGDLSFETQNASGGWSQRWLKHSDQGEDWHRADVNLDDATITAVRFFFISGGDFRLVFCFIGISTNMFEISEAKAF